MSYYLWTGGDYQDHTNYLSQVNSDLIKTSLHKSNGNFSLELVSRDQSSNAFLMILPPLSNEDVGKTLTFSVDIYSPTNMSRIQTYANNVYRGIDIPINSDFETYTLSTVIAGDIARFYCYINIMQGEHCYFDNVTIHIQ